MLMVAPFSKKNVYVLGAIVFVVLFVGTVTYYLSDQAAREEANQAKNTLFAEGVATPYVDQNGVPTSLDSYLGKIIVVNSWASWSPFSVQELQDLNIIAEEFKDKNVVVVAVNRKEHKDQAERFLNTLPPLPHLKIVTDTTDYFYNAVDGYAMPETLFYNEAGSITLHHKGALSRDELRSQLESILKLSES